MFFRLCCCLIAISLYGLFSQESFPFLDIEKTGAADFIRQNPAYNGNHVVIIILDTGVDMGVDGLKYLPDGDIKVIDAQDFSREGDIYYEKAERSSADEESYLQNSAGFRLYGIDRLKLQPVDSVCYIGVLREEKFKNTTIPDIDNNGKSNDQFGFTVFETEDDWVAYIDLDGDTHVDDEKPVYNYKKKYQSIQFGVKDNKKKRDMASFAINIFPEDYRINFHYDGSGHGTHVAGIAAGYHIFNQSGLNGIAPGAKIISLKIGDCRLSGGATTSGSMLRAYEYGLAFAKKYDGPVVFNMSFGIGSETEGLAEMDIMLDDMLAENPDAFFCLSAGNEGPGISTIGLPAASKLSLSVGALNTVSSARNVYGANLRTDKLFVFSSRGGELFKPDVIAPGAAASTIPSFSTDEIKWGTSMASPQAAGAVALIMSAAVQQNPPLPIDGALLKKAVINSAAPVQNYLLIEQGHGVINIPKAFKFYKKYISELKNDILSGYTINTLSPVYENERGQTAYWRFGGYLPDAGHKQRFYIDPLFRKNASANHRHSFYRSFNLSSTASWLKTNKSSTYIKGEQSAVVDVYFDQSQLRNPGLYCAKINGFLKDGWLSGDNPENLEFELLATAVVPIVFNEQNGWHWKSSELNLEPGNVHRVFFEIPDEFSSALIKLNSSQDNNTVLRSYLFDPKGMDVPLNLYLNPEKRDFDIARISKNDLKPGIWELDIYADFRNESNTKFDVEISFSRLKIDPEIIHNVNIKNGDLPSGSIKVTNKSRDLFEGRLSGEISGIQQERQIYDNSDLLEIPFAIDQNCEKVTFDIEIPVGTFNQLTDFAVNIKDYSDKTLKTAGFTYHKLSIDFYPPESGDYFLELIPAFASGYTQDWSAKFTESYYSFNKISIDAAGFELYPGVEKTIEFSIKGNLQVAPQNYNVFGELQINSNTKNYHHVKIPIKIDTGLK